MTPLKYRWAHGVNSYALLADVQRQIKEAQQHQFAVPNFVNAIEADIIWSEDQEIPVMGHPPAITGDLTFSHFLSVMLDLALTLKSLNFNFKTPLIVKCDFKSSRAFEMSLEMLIKFMTFYPYSKGIFINADILPGPANSDYVAFDASTFLNQVYHLSEYEGGKHRDKLVLSVGWTTANNNEEEIHREYSLEMVHEMLRALQPLGDNIVVTFPIRATSVRKSWPALRLLLESKNYGLTLWWTKTQISDEELEWIFSTLENEQDKSCIDAQPTYAGRTFYDIKGFDNFLAKRSSSNAQL
ncbi:hypothetical protein Plhal703r1_c09g0048261 [Plasmopara halstedii]